MKTRTIEKLVNGNIAVTIPVRLKYDGHKTVIVRSGEMNLTEENSLSPLQKAVLQGHRYQRILESGNEKNISELARKEQMERTFLYRSLNLVNLAPDIIEMILTGSEPKTITLTSLKRGFPDDWHEQRILFGIK